LFLSCIFVFSNNIAFADGDSLVPCTDNCNLCDIILGIKRIFGYLGTLLIIVATLFIIIAGIAYMVSGGSKNLMEWAKKL